MHSGFAPPAGSKLGFGGLGFGVWGFRVLTVQRLGGSGLRVWGCCSAVEGFVLSTCAVLVLGRGSGFQEKLRL